MSACGQLRDQTIVGVEVLVPVDFAGDPWELQHCTRTGSVMMNDRNIEVFPLEYVFFLTGSIDGVPRHLRLPEVVCSLSSMCSPWSQSHS